MPYLSLTFSVLSFRVISLLRFTLSHFLRRHSICSNNARFVFRLSVPPSLPPSVPLSISRKQQLAHLTHHEYRTIAAFFYFVLPTVTSLSSVKNFSVCVLIRICDSLSFSVAPWSSFYANPISHEPKGRLLRRCRVLLAADDVKKANAESSRSPSSNVVVILRPSY